VVLVPVGAAAKEHGPHLPLDTDFRLARALAERVAAALPVVVAPTIGFGYYPAFTKFPGSQTLRAETFVALVVDLIGGFIDQGVRHLAILNTGVSTEAPLRLAARDVLATRKVRVPIADIARLGRGADRVLQQKLGGHADERETSAMLALAPERVRMDRARPDYGHRLGAAAPVFQLPTLLDRDPASGADFSATGAIGDPTLATAAKGEAILGAMALELIAGLRAAFPGVFEP
jgi:creatinine amidohydrolase